MWPATVRVHLRIGRGWPRLEVLLEVLLEAALSLHWRWRGRLDRRCGRRRLPSHI